MPGRVLANLEERRFSAFVSERLMTAGVFPTRSDAFRAATIPNAARPNVANAAITMTNSLTAPSAAAHTCAAK
jgi:hypothetical protein